MPSSGSKADKAPYPSERQLELDGLRGIAILLVVAVHLPNGIYNTLSPNFLNSFFSVNLGFGIYGVDIFFVLSGFLITRIIINFGGSSRFIPWFYTRRILRVVPLAIAGVMIATGLSLTFNYDFKIISLLREILFLGNYEHIISKVDVSNNGFKGSLDTYWSLSVEEQYYIFWPFVLLAVSNIRYGIAISIGFIVLSTGLRFLYNAFDLLPVEFQISYAMTPFRLDGFGLGAIVAFLQRGGSKDTVLTFGIVTLLFCGLLSIVATSHVGFATISTAGHLLIALLLAASTCFAGQLVLHSGLLKQGSIIFSCAMFPVLILRLDPVGGHTLPHLLAGLSAAALIAVLLNSKTIWNSIFSFQPLVFVGTISFGIYVYEPILFFFTTDFLSIMPEAMWPKDAFLMVSRVVIVFLVASISWYWFEKPLIDLKYSGTWARISRTSFELRQWKRGPALFGFAAAAFCLIGLPALLIPLIPPAQYLTRDFETQIVLPNDVSDTGHYTVNVPKDAYAPENLFDATEDTCWHSPPPDSRKAHGITATFSQPENIAGIRLSYGTSGAISPNSISIKLGRQGEEDVLCKRLIAMKSHDANGRIYALDECRNIEADRVTVIFDDSIRQYTLICEVEFHAASRP